MRRRNAFCWPVLAGVLLFHAAGLLWMATEISLPAPAVTPPMIGVLISPASSAGDTSLPKKPQAQEKTAEKPEKRPALLPSKATKPEKTPLAPASESTAAHAGSSEKNAGLPDSGSGNAKGKEPGASGNGPFFSPRADAPYLNNPKPTYPIASRRMGEEGSVTLSVHVLADGTVAAVQLKKSSGYPRLDASAMQAVKKWRYIPARQGNTPIPYWYTQTVTFSLTD